VVTSVQAERLRVFWERKIRELGRRTLYIDTSAILGDLEHGSDRFKNFFSKTIGYRYVTSTYVVAETCRRLVKSNTKNKFCGPKGEREKELSLWVLRAWLDRYNVTVICLDEDGYALARTAYIDDRRSTLCDLTDMISFTIVKGLEQGQILSGDSHFAHLGLACLP